MELERASLPDGTRISLHREDGHLVLRYDGLELMSTDLTHSEQLLAELGCDHLRPGTATRPAQPRVLIGGLGMGFTLRRVLALIGSPATVEVAEIMPQVIEWNRTHLAAHHGPLLDDPRTEIIATDLFDALDGLYDAILIDIDDTPDAVITDHNARLYSPDFLGRLRTALRPGGCLAYWMAEPSPRLERALRNSMFTVEEVQAKAHPEIDEAWHRIYLARPSSPAADSRREV